MQNWKVGKWNDWGMDDTMQNGQCELSVRRDGINKIVIWTQTPLMDAQVDELFWCIGAMQRSGKTLKDLLKEQEAVEPKKENDRRPEPWTTWWYACGDCGQPIDKMDRYCRRCGKKVKWK